MKEAREVKNGRKDGEGSKGGARRREGEGRKEGTVSREEERVSKKE